MASKFLLLLVLLGSVSSDRLRFHLENLVDRNVSACNNFYDHACSQHVDPKEFFMYRVRKLYNDAVEAFTPGSDINSAISFDLEKAGSVELKLEDNNYVKLARERCKSDFDCYFADLQFYALQFNIREVVKFHKALQSRVHIIEFMKSNETYTDFHEVKDISEAMKDRMIKNIEESAWLNVDDDSKNHLSFLKERVASIKVYHDFDDIDKNITTLQKLNRNMNEYYFTRKRKTGVEGLDVFLGVREAYLRLESESTHEMKILMSRIGENFEANAFFNSEMATVTMLAPLMYKPTLCTEILEEPIVTYFVLGHELYHSLFSPYTPELLELYGDRSKCIERHYERSCIWAKGSCRSGSNTITEDGPDLESFRLIHSLLLERYTPEELPNRSEALAQKDRHSALNVRINSAFSLMPEFTNAFGCTLGDPMYIQEEDSCYVFGPNS